MGRRRLYAAVFLLCKLVFVFAKRYSHSIFILAHQYVDVCAQARSCAFVRTFLCLAWYIIVLAPHILLPLPAFSLLSFRMESRCTPYHRCPKRLCHIFVPN